MPNCDVCLVECRDGGVLACRHVVCRSCGMSQSRCLVCAEIVGKNRRRPGKRVAVPRPARADDAARAASPGAPTAKEASPSPPPRTAPALRSPDVLPAAPSPSPPLPLTKSSSPTEDDASPEPPLKLRKREDGVATPIGDGIVSVTGPTAYDEVRCELRALGSAPRLSRNALRTTGKLSVGLLAKFVHTLLQLPDADRVVLRCSGEDLASAITLGHLVTHVWPESEGHMVLDYRVTPGGVVAAPP